MEFKYEIGQEVGILSDNSKIGEIVANNVINTNGEDIKLVTVRLDDNTFETVTEDNLFEPTYRLTPKGILIVVLYEHLPDMNMDMANEIYEEFVTSMENHGYLKEADED